MSYESRRRTSSVRGVPYENVDSQFDFGRRGTQQEFLHKDTPEAPDIGRKGRVWKENAFVYGDDYDLWRDRLIAALEAPGPCQFVTSSGKTHRVKVVSGSVMERVSEQGVAYFSFTLVEAGKNSVQAYSSIDGRRLLENRLTDFLSAVQNQVAENLQFDQMPGYMFDAIEDSLSAYGQVTALVDMSDPLSNSLAGLKTGNPDVFAASLMGLGQAFGSQQVHFNRLDSFDGAFQDATIRNQKIVNAGLRRAALVGMTNEAIGTNFASRNDAIESRINIYDRLQPELLSSAGNDIDADDAVFNQLQNMQHDVSIYYDSIMDPLPEVETVNLNGRQPLALVARDVYGDGARVDELVARSGSAHPLFPDEDSKLEILKN